MNPFDLRGPAFLAFYALASVIGLLLLYLVSRGLLSGSPRLPTGEARRQLRDPYLLSYLRGGVNGALLTVAFSLHERKLLNTAGETLIATGSKESLQAVTHPLERAVLSRCSSPRTMQELTKDAYLDSVVQNYAASLRESGLVADQAELGRRLPAFLVVAGTLLALSAIKLYLAFQRGHSNVVFLIMLTLIVLIVGFAIFQRRRTYAGDRALSDQQTLFARLKNRVKRLAADGATNEAVLVAATFGLAALPAEAYPFAAQFKRQVQRDSSSSSGCGSSCGGGGGGGCGGCGG